MTTPRVGDQRPGGRAERVRTSVLAATFETIGEVGYDALSIEAVASRAGVHKTTVYRRWPTKHELVTDAVHAHADRHIPIPDTGGFDTDLQAFARSVAANLGTERGARQSRALIASALASEQLAEGTRSFFAVRFDAAGAIVERAIDRGDLSPDVEPGLIIEAVTGPLWARLLLTGRPVDREFADQVSALVTLAAASS